MKKQVLFLTFYLGILIVGCKKDNTDYNSKTQQDLAEYIKKRVENNSLSRGLPQNVSVHERNFLIFPTLEDFCDFTDFMDSSTHIEMQEYLSSLGFNSNGSSLYGPEYEDESISEDQQVDYVYGEDAIIQIQGVVMKAINSDLFLLTVTEENFDDETYFNLRDSTFDELKMNKFATNPSEGFDLFEFIEGTPYGYEDTTPNNSSGKRKFWGWQCVINQGLYPQGNCIVEACMAVHCIFWICGQEQPHILSINCT